MRNDGFAHTEHTHLHKHLICWRSTLAGLAVAVLTFVGLMALALAFGGIGLSDGSSMKAAGTFAAGSVILSTVLAAFAGGYLTARATRTQVDTLGTTQGLVLGAVFLLFVLFQVTSVVGSVGRAAGQTLGAGAAAIGSGVASASENPMVQEMIEDNFGDLKTKSEASVVVRGVASRLSRGDQEGAKNYLAAQAGLTPTEADQRIATVKAKADEAAVQLREGTATAMKATGWSLFVVIVLGMVAAGLGGLTAAKFNERYTLDTSDEVKANFKSQPARS